MVEGLGVMQMISLSPLTLMQFHASFLEKYVPLILRDRKQDEFIDMQHSSMTLVAYEAKFHPCLDILHNQ